MLRYPAVIVVAWAVIVIIGAVGLSACESSSPPRAQSGYAWTTGRDGTILMTSDGGAQWSAQQSGTKRDLGGVAFADRSHGWIVGGSHSNVEAPISLVLSTTDAGVNWNQTTIGRAGGYLTAVTCADTTHIWTGGSGPGIASAAVIHASSDGGTTWTEQYSGPTVKGRGDFIYDLTFADSTHGWATTYSGRVLATTDGGAHWVEQTTLSADAMAMGATCTDTLHCWVVGQGPKSPRLLVATSDGGTSWHREPVPEQLGSTDAIWSDQARRLYLGGAGTSPPGAGAICTSSDGGATWQPGSGIPGQVSAIAGDGSEHLWAINIDSIVVSTDGGATWTTSLHRPDLYFRGIGCPPVTSASDG
jgi:photosystem II stability/assembly factor-like uncharacterized protein